MKTLLKLTILTLTLAMLLSLCAACAKDTDDGADVVPLDPFGVTLSVKDVTPTGLTLVCTQSGGSPTGTLQTAAAFRVDKNVYDHWVHQKTILAEDEEYVWDTDVYEIPKDGACEIILDWSDLYGTLPAGSYRLAKGVSDLRDDGGADAFTYFVEFEIVE